MTKRCLANIPWFVVVDDSSTACPPDSKTLEFRGINKDTRLNGFEPKPNPGRVPPRRKEGANSSRQAGARTHSETSSTTRRTVRRKPAPARRRTAPNRSEPLRRHPRRRNRANRQIVEATQFSQNIEYGRFRYFQASMGPRPEGRGVFGANAGDYVSDLASMGPPKQGRNASKREIADLFAHLLQDRCDKIRRVINSPLLNLPYERSNDRNQSRSFGFHENSQTTRPISIRTECQRGLSSPQIINYISNI